MEISYLILGSSPLAFIVALLVINEIERRMARRDESAVNPMSRQGRAGGTDGPAQKIGSRQETEDKPPELVVARFSSMKRANGQAVKERP
ncbi:MAG: hypothetical protein A4E57_00653 [Syntrophorhabdaceae bacterium PtaU1.Bin034]|jgi:hypothetical protein|nr:MAG: hypothetical protein A4E57_00653 [Syntrophorhabdaceae bacterium PtaU1.Bin034]